MYLSTYLVLPAKLIHIGPFQEKLLPLPYLVAIFHIWELTSIFGIKLPYLEGENMATERYIRKSLETCKWHFDVIIPCWESLPTLYS